ncbi:MAG: cob(I)yrinic acid a,c-diamide adenosyltransferase [Proteobacteria bacterium]|nr:MAG: cob(I)yrinic acid a,c-diamide adenosyltransferase [Pseudomonadota bacterium]
MNFLEKVQASRGLVIIYTGDGKGKTTAALGTAFRAMGRGLRVGMVQFIKGKWISGERMLAPKMPLLDFFVAGRGYVESPVPNFGRSHEAARVVWNRAKEMILSGEYPLVILDEITFAVQFQYVSVEEILDLLSARPAFVSVIITGRDASPELIEIADLVSEMKSIKHPYEKGELAKVAIDY